MIFSRNRCLALGLIAFSLPLAVQANQSLSSPGFARTTGGTVNHGSAHASGYNPAGNNLLIAPGKSTRFGILSNIGVSLELGESEDLDDKMDLLVDDLDALDILDDWENVGTEDRQFAEEQFARFGDCTLDSTDTNRPDGDTRAACYQGVADSINNDLLADLEKGGQIRFGAHASLPLMPFLFRVGDNGSMGLNVGAGVQSRGDFVGDRFGVRSNFSVGGNDVGSLNIDTGQIGAVYVALDDFVETYDETDPEADLNKLADDLVSIGLSSADVQVIRDIADDYGNNIYTDDLEAEAELTTKSSFDFKTAALAQLSINYAHNLTSAFRLDPLHGELEIGTRLNYFQARMYRSFVSFEDMAEDDDDDDAFDKAVDDFTDYENSASAMGLDIGLLWHARNYQVGATLYNINEPRFDYPDLNDFLEDRALDAAQSLAAAGKVTMAESAKLRRHAVLEAAVFNSSRNLMLNTWYTVGKASNLVNDEFQNVGVSAGYYTQSWLIPGVRLGYNKNLTGTELDIVSLGVTLFGIFNLDLAASTQTSSFDDDEAPRYIAFSFGFERKM